MTRAQKEHTPVSPRTKKDVQGWADVAPPDSPLTPDAIVDAAVGDDAITGDIVPVASDAPSLDLEHFTLTTLGLTVKGRPSFDEWAGIGAYLHIMVKGIQWCVGDWIAW